MEYCASQNATPDRAHSSMTFVLSFEFSHNYTKLGNVVIFVLFRSEGVINFSKKFASRGI